MEPDSRAGSRKEKPTAWRPPAFSLGLERAGSADELASGAYFENIEAYNASLAAAA